LVDRIKSSGFTVLKQTDDEVVVKVLSKGDTSGLGTVEYDERPLYNDREIRNFLTVHS
jgi:hypothetical protein